MDLRKIYALAIALSKSQLRTSTSGRAGASLFRRPVIVLLVDLAAFVVTAGIGYLVLTALQQGFPSGASSPDGSTYTSIVKVIQEALIFVPTFVPSSVLLGGVLFELNVSSKFSASDTVNWLPITQVEYVLASSISVAYNYSVLPSVFLGITLAPAIGLGFAWAWVGVAFFSVVTLVMGGVLVEILRAAVNRVSSLVSSKTRRGGFAARLGLLVVIIIVIDTSFNPNFLIQLVGSLSSTLSLAPSVPILWGSIAVEGIINGETVRTLIFTPATVVFTGVLVWVAVKVRSRYWSPMVAAVAVSNSEYRPQSGLLSRLGLSSNEAAMVRKDLRGVTRRRELLSYFAVPIVFVAIFLIDMLTPNFAGGSSQAISIVTEIPIFLAGTIFALMISSISFGQESKSVMVLYSLPISPDQILKAKAFVAMAFALTATLATFAIFSVLGGQPATTLIENLAIALATTVEEVFVGLAFGAAHPDFQERPRPRFVDPYWLIVMIPAGFIIAGVTVVPVIIRDIVGTFPAVGPTQFYLFPAALAFAAVVTTVSYRSARASVRKMMSEYRI